MSIKTKVNIIPKAANYTVLASDSNSRFSNEGSSGLITFTLPAAEVGLIYGFFVENSNGISIVPTVGIRIGSTFLSGVSGINSTDTGSYILLVCYKTDVWTCESCTGNWDSN